MNSTNFFLVEIEEIKSCICRVKTANTGTGLVVLASSGCTAAWGYCTFHERESLQTTIYNESLQSLSNAEPANCWAPFLYWQKSQWEDLDHSQREMNQSTDAWVAGCDWLFAVEDRYSF